MCQAIFSVPKEGARSIPTNIANKQLLDNFPQTMPRRKDASGGVCHVHKKEGCEFVCRTCHVALCDDCMIGISQGPHAQHTLDKLEKALASMEQDFSKLEHEMKKVEIDEDKAYADIRFNLMNCKDNAIAKAEVKANRAIKEATAWKTKTMKKINADYEETSRKLQMIQDDYKQLRKEMKDEVKKMQDHLDAMDMQNGNKSLDGLTKTLEKYKNNIPSMQHITLGLVSDLYILNLGEFEYAEPKILMNGEFYQF